MIYAVRTTVGRESAVLTTLTNRVKSTGLAVKAMFKPSELKGYIFVEGELQDLERLVVGVPHVRRLIRTAIPIAELKKFLESGKVEIKVSRGDVVEISGGPFKGEKGRVVRVDEAKEEVTVELLEAAVPIPVTVSTDSIRILEKQEEG